MKSHFQHIASDIPSTDLVNIARSFNQQVLNICQIYTGRLATRDETGKKRKVATCGASYKLGQGGGDMQSQQNFCVL